MTLNEVQFLLQEEIDRACSLGIKLRKVSNQLLYTKNNSVFAENYFSKEPNQILINKSWLDTVTDIEEVRTVIAHEVLHSITGSKGHDERWRSGVRRMKKQYHYKCAEFHLAEHPYSRERIIAGQADGHTPIPKSDSSYYKYEVMCPICQNKWQYKHLCSTVKHPELASCRICSNRIRKVHLIRTK